MGTGPSWSGSSGVALGWGWTLPVHLSLVLRSSRHSSAAYIALPSLNSVRKLPCLYSACLSQDSALSVSGGEEELLYGSPDSGRPLLGSTRDTVTETETETPQRFQLVSLKPSPQNPRQQKRGPWGADWANTGL